MYALAALTILDYLSGVARAAATRTLSSEAGMAGIARKAMIFALVGAAHTVDAHLLGSPGGGAARTAVIFFFAGNEGLSILENAAAMGLPVPPALKSALMLASRAAPPEGGGGEGGE